MKTLIIFTTLLVVALALTEEQKAKIKSHHEACQKESQADPALIEKVKKGEFIDDPKLKAHILCFGKKTGMVKKDGSLDLDVIRQKGSTIISDKDELEKVIKLCAIVKDTPENTAFDLAKCLKLQAKITV